MKMNSENEKIIEADSNGEKQTLEKKTNLETSGGPLLVGWEAEIRLFPDFEYVKDVVEWLLERSEKNGVWNWDHVTLNEALVNNGLMEEVRFYMRPKTRSLLAVWTPGKQMVGHPSIVHGGAIAFAFDESFGILFASLGLGPGFTAHLDVDFRKPFAAGTSACLEAHVDRIDRRKVFLKGKLRNGPEGEIYAEGSALFVVAKKNNE